MNLIGFKVWLDDKHVVRADNFVDLPTTGIIILMAYYDEFYDPAKRCRYRKVTDGCDWYYFDRGDVHGIYSSDRVGEWQPKPEGIADELIKQGIMIDKALFDSISDQAMEDLIY